MRLDKEKFYTINETAKILRVCTKSVYKYVNAGKLKALKAGGSYRISEKDLREFMEVSAK